MLANLRKLIKKLNIDAILINSTNEYLVEYNSLNENARYMLTGFSGSCGDAVVTENNLYLFVDGRYHIQADKEVNSSLTTVIKLKNGETFMNKLLEILPQNSSIGIVGSKNSQTRFENFQKYYNTILLENDTIPTESSIYKRNETKLNKKKCGQSTKQKLQLLRKYINTKDAILVTNLEEVSYLFNRRNFSKNYSSKITARAIITSENAKLFYPEDFIKYKKCLETLSGNVYVDKNSINARDYEILKNKAKPWEKNPIKEMKSIKTEAEIEEYKDAFKKTDKAVMAIREYIYNNDNISEYDIDKRLEEEFLKYGAKNLSFKSIIAKDKNSALAHYSKSSKEEIIEDGSLILIDCGAYYEGGLATDITRVFVKGKPCDLHKKIYTTVLRAFLHAFNTKITSKTCGYDIDKNTREFLNANHTDGFEFNHGLGHGIGISVHENPPNLSCNEIAHVTLKDNMCFTIEPGLYNKDYFGVRLENSCYIKNNKIYSFVNMGYEKKLIDYSLLLPHEQEWLKNFEVL